MSIVPVHGPHTWGQPFFAEGELILVNMLGPYDLEFKSKNVPGISPEEDPYEWDFGDGTQAVNGFEVRHVFAEPGVFTVTLTVQTVDGPVTDQVEINLGDGHREEVPEEAPLTEERAA